VPAQEKATQVRRLKIERKEEESMDTTLVVRAVAGVLAVIVLAILIYRRKSAKA